MFYFQAHARVEADRARAGVEKAARALAGGAGECQDLERRVDELIRLVSFFEASHDEGRVHFGALHSSESGCNSC